MTQRHWKKTKELAFLSLISVIYNWKWVQTKVNVYKTTRFIQKVTRNWQIKLWQFLPNFCTHFRPIYRPVGQLGPNLTWFSKRYASQVPVGTWAFSINIKWVTASQSQACFLGVLPNFHTHFGPMYKPVGQLSPNLTWFSERYASQVPVAFYLEHFWWILSELQPVKVRHVFEFCQIFVHVLGLFTGPWAKLTQIWLDFSKIYASQVPVGFFWSIFDKY